MNLDERIAQYVQERDTNQAAKDKAHKRILELNALIKKLHFAKRDIDKILEPETSAAEDLKEITENLK